MLYRISRLNIDLQHLVIITFPRTRDSYELYLFLRDNESTSPRLVAYTRVFSNKLITHPVYSKSIINHLDIPSTTKYYVNGQISSQTWKNKKGDIHRYTYNGIDLPAYINYHENGCIHIQEWYKDGNLHRDTDLPAHISYYANGKLAFQSWWKNGKRHREAENGLDSPAIIRHNIDGEINFKEWFVNGYEIKH